MTEENPWTTLNRILVQNNSDFKFKDNEIAHEIINDIIKKLIERINRLEAELVEYQKNIDERFTRLETFCTTQLLGPESLQFKPPGKEEYYTIKQVLEDLYSKINTLEYDNR